jgi:predicted nucleic acid-binding protein
MRYLFDSGMLLRLGHRLDPGHSAARSALRVLRNRGDSVVSAPQNVAEFWNVATRPLAARGGYGLTFQETKKRLRMLERVLTVLPDAAATYSIWKGLIVAHAVRGVQVHDARLVAFMQAHGVNDIVTFNSKDFTRYAGINVHTPAAFAAPPPTP